MSPDQADAWVVQMHALVDQLTAPLEAAHAARLQCRAGCTGCCVDDLTVFEVEAERIRRAHPTLLETAAPHPPGACAMLDAAGRCRIYDARPYVCRTQGLPLRWVEEAADARVVERRDICPLNEPGPPLDALPAEACWALGPFEDRLARVQEAVDGGVGRRVPLRSLLARDES